MSPRRRRQTSLNCPPAENEKSRTVYRKISPGVQLMVGGWRGGGRMCWPCWVAGSQYLDPPPPQDKLPHKIRINSEPGRQLCIYSRQGQLIPFPSCSTFWGERGWKFRLRMRSSFYCPRVAISLWEKIFSWYGHSVLVFRIIEWFVLPESL
jgi:hypothetical protein